MIDKQVSRLLSVSWWVLLLRGVCAILFGIFAWFQPETSLTALILLFGVYTLVDGTLEVLSAFMGRKEQDYWWVLLIGGMLGIVVGFLTLMAPEITLIVLMLYIAIWAITKGVVEIVAAVRLRKEIEGEWLLIGSGLLSVLFGIILMMQPMLGAISILWMVAFYAVLLGVITIILALKMRSVVTTLREEPR